VFLLGGRCEGKTNVYTDDISYLNADNLIAAKDCELRHIGKMPHPMNVHSPVAVIKPI
jgi:hypothetical protein